VASKILVNAAKQKLIYKAFKKAGPELFTNASSENFLTLLFTESIVG
jgi:hypothetical protein